MPPNDILSSPDRTYPPINFNDDEGDPNGTFDRYKATGDKIIQWANDPASRPTNMDDLRQQLAGLVDIPANMKNLVVIQGDDTDADSTVFVLRLPPKNQLNESGAIVQNPGNSYPLPGIYSSVFPVLDMEDRPASDWLSARVADYTMRGCR